jgi:hypothetical protein
VANTFSFSCRPSELFASAQKTFPTDPTRKTQTYVEDVSKFLEVAISSAIANAAVGGGDLAMCGVLPVAHSSNATLDLMNFTDLMDRAAQAFARIKFVAFFLPSTAQDATVGTDATSVTIGNSGANASLLFLGAAADTLTLKNGGWHMNNDPSAAGVLVDATHKDVKVVNNDTVEDANLVYLIIGGST